VQLCCFLGVILSDDVFVEAVQRLSLVFGWMEEAGIKADGVLGTA
jgi:hypothetical protein